MGRLNRFLASNNKQELLWLQLQSVQDKVTSPSGLLSKIRWMRYLKSINAGATIPAPYSVDFYRKSLTKLNSCDDIIVGTLGESVGETLPYVVLRHDIDLPECVSNLYRLTDVEEELGLRSSIVVRVDGLDYDPVTCKELISDHVDRGFEIGLHSTAYFDDDPLSALGRELDEFKKIFGICPKVYNFHGGFDEHLVKRIKLGRQFDQVKRKWPFLKISDSNSGFYDYRISDCKTRNGQRVILQDSINPPLSLILKSHKLVLFLTHPCYWR